MALVANDPKAAKRLKIPQSVGKEFMKADKGKKFKEGGDVMSDAEIAKVIESNMKKSGSKKINSERVRSVKPAPKKGNPGAFENKINTFERTPATDEADYATLKAQEKYFKKGGSVKKHRGDGCAVRGKTKGRFV